MPSKSQHASVTDAAESKFIFKAKCLQKVAIIFSAVLIRDLFWLCGGGKVLINATALWSVVNNLGKYVCEENVEVLSESDANASM